MPNWKRVITSGSNASLNHITASGDISGSATSTGSFGHLMVEGGNFTSASLAAGGGGVSFPTTEVVSSSAALYIGNVGGAYVSASQGNLEISGSGTALLEVLGNISGSLTSTGSFGQVDVANKLFINGANNEVNLNVIGLVTGHGHSDNNNRFTLASGTGLYFYDSNGSIKRDSSTLQFQGKQGHKFLFTDDDYGLSIGTNTVTGYGFRVQRSGSSGTAIISDDAGNNPWEFNRSGSNVFSGSSTSTGSFGRVEATNIEGTLVTAAQTNITSVGTIGTGTWQGTEVGLGYGGTELVGETDGKIVIADGAGAPVHLDVGSSTGITILGTIATGVWNGTVVASAYLDSDTAHLTTDQTFSGNKTFSSAITASGDISASGTITANSFVGTLTGTSTGLTGTPDITVGSLTATSITSSIVTSSILYTEGSNIFGDATSDTHTFNGSIIAGHITASGNISGSATSTGSFGRVGIGMASPSAPLHVKTTMNTNTNTDALKVEGNYLLGILGAHDTLYNSGKLELYKDGGDVNVSLNAGGTSTYPSWFIGPLGVGTTSPDQAFNVHGNIHVSGSTMGHITASGNISASGTITADNYGGNISGSSISTGSFGKLSINSADPTAGVWPYVANLAGDVEVGGKLWVGDEHAAGMTFSGIEGFANDLVIDGGSSTGMTLVSTATGKGTIGFSNYNDGDYSWIRFDANNAVTTFKVAGTEDVLQLTTTKISGSSTSTGSFGRVEATTFKGDGSGLTNVSALVTEWDGTRDGDAQITGSLILSGSGDTTLTVEGNITASGNISGSSTSTGSFGHLMVGGGNFTSASLAAGGESGVTSAVAGSGIDVSGATGAVTISIGTGEVVNAMIGDDEINSEHYAAGSIDNEHLADDAVDSDELAAGAVDDAHLSDGVATGLAGAGMTATSGVLNVIGGTGITANANEITTTDGDIVHDNLSGFVANEHIDHTSVTLTAGDGMTGGGDISSNRTFTVVGGDGISVAADAISVDSASMGGFYSGSMNSFTTAGDISASGHLDVVTVSASANIYAPSIGAGVDDSVVILDSDGTFKTDEIDSRVWSVQLLSGDGGPLNDNYIPYASDGGSGFLDSSNLYWDSNKLGIGTGHAAAPPKTLTVAGDISASGDLDVVNISGSGKLVLGGGTFTSASLAAGGGGGGSGTVTQIVAGDGLNGGTITSTGTISVDSASMGGFYSGSMNSFTTTGDISASGGYYGSRTFETGSITAVGNNSGADIVYFGAGSLTTGTLYYLATNGTWTAADASDNTAGADELLGIALGSSATSNGVLLRGVVNVTGISGLTNVGRALYISTTAGDVTETAPSSNNEIVRIVGYVLNANDTMYFNPDSTWVKVTA